MPKRAMYATCHPDRKHKAKGLCNQCYNVGRNATYRAKNADAIKVARAKKRADNPEIYAARRLRLKYGMSLADLNLMLEQQGHKCAICDVPIDVSTRHVDHCHERGNVRGLLCGACNVGLGNFKDKIESLERAISYLKREPTSFKA